MIIEDERPEELMEDTNDGGEVLREEYRWRNPLVLLEFLKIHKEIEDKQAHERILLTTFGLFIAPLSLIVVMKFICETMVGMKLCVPWDVTLFVLKFEL
jgi:hypothetical protein